MKNIKQIEEYIRAKCVEANPSILDLKFGCELEDKMFGVRSVYLGGDHSSMFTYNSRFTSKMFTYSIGSTSKFAKHNFKILGRPLELSDIFFAVEHNRKRDGIEYLVDTSGWFIEYNRLNETQKRKIRCTLSLPFLEQSDEVKIFIGELLGYKE